MPAIHLMERAGVYYFRRVLPSDVRPYFPAKEIWRSLRTRDRKAAIPRVERLNSETERVITLIRSRALNRAEIHRVVKTYLERTLDGLEHHRESGSTLHDLAQGSPLDVWTWNEDLIPLAGGFPDAHGGSVPRAGREQLVSHYKQKVEALEAQLAGRHIDLFLEEQANALIAITKADIPTYSSNDHEGFANHSPMPQEFRVLCFELLKAKISTYRIEIERLMGNYDNAYDRATERLLAPPTDTTPSVPPAPPADTSPSVPPAPAEATPGPTLTEVIDMYMAEIREKGLEEVTYGEYEDACRLLVRIIGEKPAAELTRDDIRTYRDTIRKLPAHMNKRPETKGKSIEAVLEVAQKKRLKPISDAAVKKKLGQVKGLVKWASGDGVRLIPHNVGDGVNLPKTTKGPVREQKKPYTQKDIQGLVDGLVAEREKGTFEQHPERYWVPLIGIFSGMRLEEICQLHTADVREVEGVWCFDVDWLDESGKVAKRLKTGNAKRLVPVHSTLIGLGLLEYLDHIKRAGHPRLWMKLTKTARGKYQRNIKDWYNGADNRPGFENLYIDDDPKKSFHSTRHSFANALKQAGADMLVAGEVLGHKLEGLTFDRYADPYRVAIKKAVVELAQYGVEFVPRLGCWNDWP
ncbi:integrase [Desulfuromonas versatilis]|uniref:Integrase n=1 Tax=Desulfuromonas versatilis TaxID=2802975 RepID=A0ABM8HTF1_9BACT|nr:site-specific integrase [Desulfuromonas versatilis]BCR04302.1 integrase [Desulfuromonas versatilis]